MPGFAATSDPPGEALDDARFAAISLLRGGISRERWRLPGSRAAGPALGASFLRAARPTKADEVADRLETDGPPWRRYLADCTGRAPVRRGASRRGSDLRRLAGARRWRPYCGNGRRGCTEDGCLMRLAAYRAATQRCRGGRAIVRYDAGTERFKSPSALYSSSSTSCPQSGGRPDGRASAEAPVVPTRSARSPDRGAEVVSRPAPAG
jgi:hypothetical protein